MNAPKIPDSPQGKLVREVFAKFGCDPANPDHWFALFYSYIKASRRPAGRPQAWTDTELFQLICDVDETRWREESRLEKAGLEGHRLSQDAVFKKLAKQKVYSHLNWKTLKKNYYRAWMPEHNGVLKRMLDDLGVTAAAASDSRELPTMWTRAGGYDAYRNKEGKVRYKPRRLVAK
jgi:hypothetical protein